MIDPRETVFVMRKGIATLIYKEEMQKGEKAVSEKTEPAKDPKKSK